MQLLANFLTNLADRFLHLKSKLFKGKLTDSYDTAYGFVKIFESGYIEFIDHYTGESSEPMRDIHFTTYTWRVTATDGSTITLGRYRRRQALTEAEKLIGRVLYVDDSNKIIFCKAK